MTLHPITCSVCQEPLAWQTEPPPNQWRACPLCITSIAELAQALGRHIPDARQLRGRSARNIGTRERFIDAFLHHIGTLDKAR